MFLRFRTVFFSLGREELGCRGILVFSDGWEERCSTGALGCSALELVLSEGRALDFSVGEELGSMGTLGFSGLEACSVGALGCSSLELGFSEGRELDIYQV